LVEDVKRAKTKYNLFYLDGNGIVVN